MVMQEETTQPPRRIRAQDRYAQEVLTWLWGHKETECVENDGVYFYRHSLHTLIRRIRPSAQAGDVVNILREHGAIRSAGHGVWELCRPEVFQDELGRPVEADVVSYGHDPQFVILRRNVKELGDRVAKVEEDYTKLVTVVVTLAKKVDPHLVEGTPAQAVAAVQDLLDGKGADETD
jgi:hypothetical protein